MAKRLTFVFFGLIFILAISAESYTVVLKNGKTMTGTLVSENDTMIVFKDEHGLQFSLKKANLDLEKTRQANEPPPASVVPVAATPATPPPPKKEAKVYGQNDLEALRDKYGDLSPGQLIIEENGTLTPASYYKTLQGAIAEASEIVSSLKALALDVTATWEGALSTGKPAQKELNDYMTVGAGFGTASELTGRVNGLKKVQTQLANAPKAYKDVPTNFSIMVDSLTNCINLLQQFNTVGNGTYFRTSLDRMNNAADRAIATLQGVKEVEEQEPQPQPETPSPAAAAPKDQNQEPPQPQQPPDITNQEPPAPPPPPPPSQP